MASRTDKVLLYALLTLILLGGLCACCLFAAIFTPLRFWTHGGAPEAAKTYLRNNPVVLAQIGQVTGFGWFPNGSVSDVNGRGKAHLVFALKGTKGEGRAVLDLEKKPDANWTVVAARLYVGGKEFILQEPPLGSQPAPPLPGGKSEQDSDGYNT